MYRSNLKCLRLIYAAFVIIAFFTVPNAIRAWNREPDTKISLYLQPGAGQLPDITRPLVALVQKASDLAKRTGGPVVVELPKGRFVTRQEIRIGSGVWLKGQGPDKTTIVFSPNLAPTGQYIFSTRTTAEIVYYALARADDPRIIAQTKGNYSGKNFVYLQRPKEARMLARNHVRIAAISSGATLANNSGVRHAEDTAPPLTQVAADTQINPAPANIAFVKGVERDGKILLASKNEMNWGTDYHARETLAQYINPQNFVFKDNAFVARNECKHCNSASKSVPISGPALFSSVDSFTTNVLFDGITFEIDDTLPPEIASRAYGLYLGYSRNVKVENCRFRYFTSEYPILSVRSFNVTIVGSAFEISGGAAITLDSGSGYEIRHSSFTTSKKNSSVNNFILFDEFPTRVTIADNAFSDLPLFSNRNGSGIAIFGVGGADLQLINNRFQRIQGAALIHAFNQGRSIIDSNRVEGSAESNLAIFGTQGSGSAIVRNIFEDQALGSKEGIGLRLGVAFRGGSTSKNFFCTNRGLKPGSQNGAILYSEQSNQLRNEPSPRPKTIRRASYNNQGTAPNPIGAVRVLNGNKIGLYQSADLEMQLNREGHPFALYLFVSHGNLGTVLVRNEIFEVPAGARDFVIKDAFFTIQPGKVKIQVRSICTAEPYFQDVNVSVM